MAQFTFTAPASTARLPLWNNSPGGPGWYESSRELSQGLDVRELAPADASTRYVGSGPGWPVPPSDM